MDNDALAKFAAITVLPALIKTLVKKNVLTAQEARDIYLESASILDDISSEADYPEQVIARVVAYFRHLATDAESY